MVSLTASFANASTTTTTPQTLRNSAFWYPQIPGPQLYLNDNPALNKDCFMSEYQPIFWTHFGGPGGCRLNHLTGVGVLLHLHEGIAKVEFYYDDSLEKDENTLTMGRHQSCEGAEMMCFAIDGPGGERIREVGVLHRVSSNPSTTTNQDTGPQRPDFLTFKISTNWGRSCLFKTKACSSIDQGAGDKIDMHHIPIEPGTCITGFYAEQKPELGFGVTIVGVISEKVDESTACGTPSAGARRVKRARKPARGRRLLD